MAWFLAHPPEIARRIDDAPAEMVQPDPVDHDPRGEWIVRPRNRFRQIEPAASRLELAPSKDAEKAARHLRAEIVLAAADVNMLVLRIVLVMNNVQERVLLRKSSLQALDLCSQPIGVFAPCSGKKAVDLGARVVAAHRGQTPRPH